ncbi:MAG: ABC transporter permease [Alphaproteobacteria bacterium]|nr:ABC transporter permease [Alphaproteobacteria bacterium]
MGGLIGFWRLYRRRRMAVAGASALLGVFLVALLAAVISPGDPWDMAGRPLLWPGQEVGFPFGTDVLGRDILAGVVHGSRVSLAIGFAATMAALLLGVTIGAIAGYFGGYVDDVLMRFTEIVQTIPSFLLILVLVAIFSPSAVNIVIAISVSTWPPVARLVRAEFLSLREREFVQACIVLGMSRPRIILTQVLPNSLAPVVVISSVMVASAILNEASLAFLGLGDPNIMSWGTMISIGRNSLRTAWYMVAIPGIAIIITVMALNLVGEGLNDALNPRLRGR